MKPWQWIALAVGALGALWFLLTRNKPVAPSVPTASASVPQTPTIGSVADQFAKLSSIGTNVPHIDAVPSTTSIGWLGQPKLVAPPTVPSSANPGSAPSSVPSSSNPASSPDPGLNYLAAFPDAGSLYAAASSGALSTEAIGKAQAALIADALSKGLPVATGPATETRTGRGHF